MKIYIDESQKTGIYFVGLIVTNESDFCKNEIKKEMENISYDIALSLIPSVQKTLKSTGPHFAEDSIDVKNRFINLFRKLPFECYLAFGKIQNEPKKLHLDLLKSILNDRLLKLKNYEIDIIHEINQIFSNDELNKCIEDLKRVYSLDSTKTNFQFEKKSNDFNLSITDYMIGVFRDYYLEKDNSNSYQHRNFIGLRQKYRVIFNLDTKERDTRRNRLFF